MHQETLKKALWVVMAALVAMPWGCEYKAPPSPWEEFEKEVKAPPEIHAVIPEADAGCASEIIIKGAHFSPVITENNVYFNNKPAVIKTASDTELVVYRPNVVGDSVAIKITVAGAVEIAQFFPYRMKAVVEKFGPFSGLDAIVAFTVDKNENVYVAMSNNTVIRLDAQGFQDLSFLSKAPSSLWRDMKVYGDWVYLVRANNVIYRASISDTVVVEYVTLPNRSDRIRTIDFDSNGHLFGGGKNSDLMVFRSATDYQKLGFYAQYEILSLRVYQEYLYVAANYTGTQPVSVAKGIWRHAIQSDGTVGAQEPVLDWSATPYASATISTITFSENGVMYIASDHPEYPILMYNMNTGEFKPLFYKIIPSPVDQIMWGNSTFLYALVNRNTRFDRGGNFLRIDTGEMGAFYYGRQ